MENVILATLMVGLLFVQAQSASRVKREACPSTMECLTPVPMLREFVEKDNAKGLFAVSYAPLLDHVCSKKSEVESCLSRVRCDDVEEYYVGQGVKHTLDYICGDGRARLLSESKCFARDSFEQGFKLCAHALLSEFNTKSISISRGWEQSTAYCPAITNYFECVETEVKNSCSNAAADFMSTLAAKNMETLASQIYCTITY